MRGKKIRQEVKWVGRKEGGGKKKVVMKVTNAFSALRDSWMEPERQLVDCVCKIDHKLSKLSFIHPFMLKQQVNRKWLHCSKAEMMWFPFVVVGLLVECVVGLPLANFSSGG